MDDNSLKDAIAVLSETQEDAQPMPTKLCSRSPADRQRIYAIAARFMFEGQPDTELAKVLGKTTRTIERLRKDEGFITYYDAYCEKILSDVDRKIKAKLAAIAPGRLTRMIELSKQNESLHVAYQSTRWILDSAKTGQKGEMRMGAFSMPKELQDALKQAGKAAKSIPATIEAEKKRNQTRQSGGSEGSGT